MLRCDGNVRITHFRHIVITCLCLLLVPTGSGLEIPRCLAVKNFSYLVVVGIGVLMERWKS